jgi:hypothetical protein
MNCLVRVYRHVAPVALLLLCGAASADPGPASELSLVLGRPTDRAVTLSVLSTTGVDAFVEYRAASATQIRKTPVRACQAGAPCEFNLEELTPNARYSYRLMTRPAGTEEFRAQPEATFHTQRAPGSTFTFALQGDSHPERAGRMFDAGLYAVALRNAAADAPDFYLTLGDDFSIEHLLARKAATQEAVDRVYAAQRGFLGLVGRSAPLFLVNGNHEQAARYLLDGTETSSAIAAARARTRFYPLPAPDGFYTGDAEEVPHAGLLRDYYAWTWGDALFVVLDPYWHSAVCVDNEAGAEQADKRRGKRRDLWEVTMGEAQYRWLTRTLAESKARWKFVFCHHVLGTGRGGVERAGLFEWGGRDERGADLFTQKRPGWPLPIHALMAKHGVTVFFQGHDHIFARQELDGVIYQSCPNPADPTYQAFNREAYRSGDILPDSGHLRVTVAPEKVVVDYVRAWLPKDEKDGHRNGEVAFTYAIPASMPR